VDRALEEEDKQRMADATWVFDGQVRRFNSIVGRRKKKKDFEYEVQWQVRGGRGLWGVGGWRWSVQGWGMGGQGLWSGWVAGSRRPELPQLACKGTILCFGGEQNALVELHSVNRPLHQPTNPQTNPHPKHLPHPTPGPLLHQVQPLDPARRARREGLPEEGQRV